MKSIVRKNCRSFKFQHTHTHTLTHTRSDGSRGKTDGVIINARCERSYQRSNLALAGRRFNLIFTDSYNKFSCLTLKKWEKQKFYKSGKFLCSTLNTRANMLLEQQISPKKTNIFHPVITPPPLTPGGSITAHTRTHKHTHSRAHTHL